MRRTVWVGLSVRTWLVLTCMTLPIPAVAQIIINPTRVEFDSPDHHVVLPTGEPAITYYVLEVWRSASAPGTGTPTSSLELGKPTISASTTTVSVYVATFLLGLTTGVESVATIRAVGPAGEIRSGASNEFIRLNGPTPTTPPVVTDPASDIVIHAGDVQPADIHGRWALTTLADAAGGVALFNSNLSELKVSPALASPANYVEFTFNAAAGVPYRLWIRMKALNNSYANDSIALQFSDSVDAANQPAFRIGTTAGASVILEEGSGAGVSGWGWNDHGYGVLAAPIYFATSGPHVIRIQQREDGIYFDQIVLSAGTYFTKAPGAVKNDTVVVPKQ